jgi:phospholipid/cholesterol/gamma-HCH transport system permease protein
MLVVGVIGLVLAHIALHELKKVGDTGALPRVVAVGVVRELGPLMTAIVVAVRTGAGYASDLDSMRRSHEIDALRSLGISPVEVVALPRIVAVMLMLPLLSVFSSVAGLLAGALVGIDTAGLLPHVYLEKTLRAVSHQDLIDGLVKSTLYGLVIGVTACHIGLNARRPGGPAGNAAISGSTQCVLFVVLTRGLIVVLT